MQIQWDLEFRSLTRIQYVTFCIWCLSLSTMFLRFIPVVDVSVLHSFLLQNTVVLWGFLRGSVVKYPPEMQETQESEDFIPGSGRSPEGRHGNPLQYFCLENPVDRGAWWATIHRVTKSQTWLTWLSMQALFYCWDTPHFVYLFISWWEAFELFPFWGCYK